MLDNHEEGCAETPGVAEGDLEGWDEGLEEGALLKPGLLDDDEEGCAETPVVAEGELEG